MHKADIPAFRLADRALPCGNRWPLAEHAEENARWQRPSRCASSSAILRRPRGPGGGGRSWSRCSPRAATATRAPAFFREVQRLAGAAGAALILDEVQTGAGHLGHALAATSSSPCRSRPICAPSARRCSSAASSPRPTTTSSQFGRMYQTRNGDRARAPCSPSPRCSTIESATGCSKTCAKNGALFLAGLEELARAGPELVSRAARAGVPARVRHALVPSRATPSSRAASAGASSPRTPGDPLGAAAPAPHHRPGGHRPRAVGVRRRARLRWTA
jgi:4-aminobutyrate aminotransferase/(S)-3-amino-2-methylpropionate transaminase